jgi:hypothetical protein
VPRQQRGMDQAPQKGEEDREPTQRLLTYPETSLPSCETTGREHMQPTLVYSPSFRCS